MATLDHSPRATRVRPRGLVDWLTTTDHKRIGVLYLFTSLAFFVSAGIMALIMRAELASPGLDVVDEATYNQLFTMHGTAMMFFSSCRSPSASPTTSCRCTWARRTLPSPG